MANAPEDSSRDDEWLTIREAGEYLKVSEQTIFRWMRSGKLSFFKLGASTRFRRSHLDMVAEKVTGRTEGRQAAERCVVCGNSSLVEGRIRSTGRVYFQLARSRFFVLAENATPVNARTCPVCGHIQLFADTARLTRLMRAEDKPANAADEADEPHLTDEAAEEPRDEIREAT